MGSKDEETEVIGNYLAGLEDEVEPEPLSQLQHHFAAPGLYIREDYAGYLQAIDAAGGADSAFQSALVPGDSEAVMAPLESTESEIMTSCLRVYCLANVQGKTGEADTALEAPEELLTGQSQAYRELKAMFDPDRPDAIPERLHALLLRPAGKKVAAVALGLKFPEARAPYFTIARKHNFDISFPQHLLKIWMHQTEN